MSLKPCYQETIAEIEREIDVLRGLKEGLERLGQPACERGDVAAPLPTAGRVPRQDANGRPKVPVIVKYGGRPAGAGKARTVKSVGSVERKTVGSGPYPELQKHLGTRLGPVFTTAALQGLMGGTRKQASNVITQWYMAGIVRRVGPGQYRAAKGAKAEARGDAEARREQTPLTPRPKVVRAPREPEMEQEKTEGTEGEGTSAGNGRGELERRIKAACLARDSYREKGREKMAEIEQQRIDGLESQMEALE